MPSPAPSLASGLASQYASRGNPHKAGLLASLPIIVIGASAGGVEALQKLVRGLPSELDAPVFIVQHIPNSAVSVLPNILNRVDHLRAAHPRNGEKIRPNRIYVAPPDHHLTVDDGRVRLMRGPKENRHRPAIDTLFRSAAKFYGPAVIGVVLTGFLDDGTNGLITIKQRGGIAIVQDPYDAISPGMPRSAVERVDVDYVLPLAAIPAKLAELVGRHKSQTGAHAMAQSSAPNHEKPSTLTCPDCNGALWEVEEGAGLRFVCRVGHAYSVDSMFSAQADAVERALWAATRSLEEGAELSRKLARRARERDHEASARMFEQRAQSKKEHADVLRGVLSRDERQMPPASSSSEAKSA